ncbi:MAG: tetratricopeptide repeat protein [Gammaproteobacteria bacterium]|nr:tetratricopeptide repeat protein [Gammaproteobacteria bacterium]MCK5263202.1 tetratricopeptide repeat protein [Gammaproteobacteria bacterium]
MKQLINKTKTRFTVLAITLLCAGCVSGPDDRQPEAIEAANNALSNGVSNYGKSKYELATSYFKNALRDFRSIDHQYGIASSCLNLSKTYISIGNIELADAYFKQAQRIIQRDNIKQLDDHLRIIESSIAIENSQLAQAKETLAPLLQNDSNNAFTLAAVQNRTRIAHAENNNDEATQWTNTFEQKIKSSSSNQKHKARLARFKANLSDNKETQNKHFGEALNIYRSETNRPGIAATLQEWANILIKQKKTEAAKDKLQRALYIRQSLQDRKNSLKILNSLAQISDNSKTGIWIDKLQNKQFKQWEEFVAVFNWFPN